MAVVTVVVYEFKLDNEADPDLYAAVPLHEWQKSEVGQWVMANAQEIPQWGRKAGGFDNWWYEYRVTAKFEEHDATFFKLKYYDHIKRK